MATIRSALVVLVLAAIAHADDPDTVTVSGTIARGAAAGRDAPTGVVGTVEVERARGRLLLIVTAKTKLEKAVANERRPCALGDLQPGDRIEAVCSPEFTASEPPQTAVWRLTVLPARK